MKRTLILISGLVALAAVGTSATTSANAGLAACSSPANLHPNCSVSGSVTDWNLRNGSNFVFDGAVGANELGAASVDSEFLGASFADNLAGVDACVSPISAGVEYEAKRSASSSGTDVNCLMSFEYRDTVGCAGTQVGGDVQGVLTPIGASFSEISFLVDTAPVGAASVVLKTFCANVGQPAFTVKFDDGYFNESGAVPVELQGFSVE